jgi:hypothetical protein
MHALVVIARNDGGSLPDFAGHLLDKAQLGPLLFFGENIAMLRRGKAALWVDDRNSSLPGFLSKCNAEILRQIFGMITTI